MGERLGVSGGKPEEALVGREGFKGEGDGSLRAVGESPAELSERGREREDGDEALGGLLLEVDDGGEGAGGVDGQLLPRPGGESEAEWHISGWAVIAFEGKREGDIGWGGG